jgi:hypothetical protein
VEPIGRRLNAEEQAVLIVLMQEGRATEDCTIRGVATSLERGLIDVGGVLVQLERDGLVQRAGDGEDDPSWIATF